MNTDQIYRKALQILATGRMMRVTFAAPLSIVPEHLADAGGPIMLDFGRRAPTPIDDLEVTAQAISGTLRFGNLYHYCSIPWSAVYAIQAVGPAPAERAWVPTVIQGGKTDESN